MWDRGHRSYTGYRENSKRGETFIRIIITAGPTIEPLDPVRFISNRSTGYMGYKLAEEACKRRHIVTLISGPVKLKPPKVERFVSIETAEDLFRAIKRELRKSDCLVMCAAVSDFRPRRIFGKKIKRDNRLLLELLPNKDLLYELSGYKKDRLFVGFSLETEDLLENSCKKLKSKNLDIIVANRLSKGHSPFGDKKLDVCIINRAGEVIEIKKKSKSFVAHFLLDKIENMEY